ncbi:hypothetical protein TNIN_162011 [Trichonephila inaurata madagascariensis]|uniref:Uncharacterized protein n=1 Tax=Trichonephila inaurata madagascariensis TaxID=2747483 RepID=A0A8X6XRG3_9ARAC|nr:hypothetical protein TNIN_162011 [Trichonephila inaurata madagascariensis]
MKSFCNSLFSAFNLYKIKLKSVVLSFLTISFKYNLSLDFRIPNSDDDESSSSMSGYSDDDDDDVALREGSQDKYNVSNKKGKILDDMKDYMDEKGSTP